MTRALSLRSQLLLTLVGSIVCTTIVLSTIAYRAVVANLESEARRRVAVAAQGRAEAVTRLIDLQQERAHRYLIATAALCGEDTPSGNTAWELGCAAQALQDFRITERADGALMTYGTRRIAASGLRPDAVAVPIPMARLVSTPRGLEYVIAAVNGRAAVRLQFPIRDLALLFEPFGLGADGEVFLRETGGSQLTPIRFAEGAGPPPAALAATSQPCSTGPSEWVGLDYRGVPTIHAVHPVGVFFGGACVDAHLARSEPLASAQVLLVDLLVGGSLFTAVGIFLALIGSRWMAWPVRRLAASARALAAGDFERSVPVTGPSEVRELARSFAAMARALGEQVAREQRARHDAESANRAKDEFLAVLSHELRTPLTATLGWTRLLRTSNLEPARVERAISSIERSAMKQRRLIEDLLDVSRIIAGRLQLEHTVVPLADSVNAALDEVRPAADEKNVRLEVAFEAKPIVVGDALRLQQIVLNLVSNAVKFTPAGGRVSLRLRYADGCAELSIIDTGIGIAPEFLPHVFERFQQADGGPTRAHGGLGLGLSIVHHLVRLHGGQVHATSNGPGTGATFIVRLPTADLQSSRPVFQTEPAPRHRGQPLPRLDHIRILLLDDDTDTREVVRVLLEDAGAIVDCASTAADARRRLKSGSYAVIISDIAMPEEDGYTFIRSVRSSGMSIPAIALTALTRREDAEHARAAGFQVYLAKPITRDQLVAAVTSLGLRRTA